MTALAVAMRVVVMGVAGSGKSTLAAALAAALECPWQEGDALHSADSLRKMAAGQPLTETDRQPWLARVAGWLAERRAAGDCGVVSCSALRRSYRDQLRRADPDVRFVLLHPPPEELARRMSARRGHIFPAALLQSQLDTFEPPTPDEDVIVCDWSEPPAQSVAQVIRALSA